MLSIIIATYNRSEYLVDALNSLARQSIHKDKFEVVVVDNNSTDKTENVISDFKKKFPDINLCYVIEKKQGLSNARNRGIMEASGEIIAFMDDDARADKDYCLNLCNNSSLYKEFDAFGGKVIPVFEEDREPEWLTKHAWGMIAKVDLGDKLKSFDKKYPVGCNMAFRKEIFNKIGMFNSNLLNRCDDKDIFNRIKKAKLNILYMPDVVVNHFIPSDRTSENGIKKIATISGMEERIMLSEQPWKIILKIIDYLWKIAASAVIGIYYCLRGYPKKAFIIKIMSWSLIGFLKRDNTPLK